MNFFYKVSLILLLVLFISTSFSKDKLYEFRPVEYRKTKEVDLSLHIMLPEKPESKKQPAIIYFVCGGWKGFDPQSQKAQCAYFASRGMVAMVALIRTAKMHEVSGQTMVKDAKAAVRWVRANCKKYGIDPNKIVTAGTSAAGYIAASVSLIEGNEHKDQDLSISSKPNAVAICCPALQVDRNERRASIFKGMEEARKYSAIRSVRNNLPPFLIMHSPQDKKINLDGILAFTHLMKSFGNQCELRLWDYEDGGHGFDGYWGSGNPGFYGCLMDSDNFLKSLGYSKSGQTVNNFDFRPYEPKKKK